MEKSVIKKIILSIIFIFLFLSFSRHVFSTTDNNKRIDVHLHLWGHSQPTQARGPNIMPNQQGPPRKIREKKRFERVTDYVAAFENLLKQMDEYAIEKVLLMSPPRTYDNVDNEEFNELLKLKKKYPDRILVAGGGNLLNPIIHKYKPNKVTSAIKKQFKEKAEYLIGKGITAFGEMTALHLSFSNRHVFEETLPDHPLFLLLSDIAAEYNIPIDLHMEAVPRDIPTPNGFNRVSSLNPSYLQANIDSFERLLSHNRKTRIVWQHIGWDNTGYMTISLLRKLLNKHPNLYLALRVEERTTTVGGESMPNRIVDKNWKILPQWLEFFKQFPDRFVIGTDEFFGIPGKSRRSPQSFEETWQMFNQLPDDLKRKFGRTNPVEIYNIK
jgi:hypothetical protein